MSGETFVHKCLRAGRRVAGKLSSDAYLWLGLITHWSFPKPEFPDDGRKRVLILIDSDSRGGAQRVAFRLAAALADKCHVTLLIGSRKGAAYPVDPRVRLLYLPNFQYGSKERGNLRYIRELKKLYRIDTAVSFLRNMNRMNVATKGKERVIVSERNNPKLAFPEEFPLYRRLYEQADHVIFQTEEVRAMFSEKARAHSSVLPNPVSVSCLAAEQRRPRIVNAARLHRNKNQELLIRAFAAFAPAHPQYSLSIYGDGPEEARLRSLAAQLGLEDKVFFHGNVPDIHEQIADAGLFVLSSNTEGMPNALLEAMMMGLPCISTNCTGAKEVIRDGQNGLLTEMGDVDALAAAMAYMADHREEADRMGRNAMRTAEAFQSARVMEQWERLVLSSGTDA